MQTILIIEDNKDLRENTAELLGFSNYRVLTAENGNQGFTLARQQHPDLILCDLVMPQSDGWSFLQLVKAEDSTRNIPLVFFSAGSTFPVLKKQAIQQAGSYLSKPFTEQELLHAIQAGLYQAGNNHGQQALTE